MEFSRLLQRQYLSLIEKAPVPLCLVSRDLTPVYVNPAGARLFLDAGSQGKGGPGLTRFHRFGTDQPLSLEGALKRAATTGEPMIVDDLEIRRGEESRRVSLTVLPLADANGDRSGAVLVLQDRTAETEGAREAARLQSRVTALREKIAQDKQRLRTVSRRLIDIQESERRRIARELHDEIGQALTALKIQLQTLQQRLPDPSMGLTVASGVETLDRLMKQVRNLSLELRPSVLDDLGLQAALRWYVDRMRQDSGLDIRLGMDFPNTGLGQEMDMVLFRVTQEALTNVVRHAKARRVEIGLNADSDSASLSIRDDGAGFDVEEARTRAMAGQSLGLIGMMERVNLAGGRLNITAAPGNGAHIQVSLPLKGPIPRGAPSKDNP